MFNIIFYKPQDDSRGLNDIKKNKTQMFNWRALKK